MTDEQEIARIMELRAQGFNAEQIGKELFFSGSAIRKKIRKAGLSEQFLMSGKLAFERIRDDVRIMFEHNIRYDDIAVKYNVTKDTVRRWRIELGIPIKPHGGANSLHLDIEELIRLRESGKTYAEIGKIVGAAADIIGVSAAEYSAKENDRMPITREEYHNILMPLFEAIKAISEGKRCGQCRYYRESGYFSTQGSCYWKSGATEVGVSKKACVRWKPRVDSAFRFSKDERKPVVIEQIRNCGECGHDFNAIRECRFSSGACLNISGPVTEYCSNCENEVTMNWDVKKQGYQAFCPVCGKRLMLCSECLDAEDNTARGMCDYDSGTDSCFRRKGDR